MWKYFLKSLPTVIESLRRVRRSLRKRALLSANTFGSVASGGRKNACLLAGKCGF
jgi:hypothetical protein